MAAEQPSRQPTTSAAAPARKAPDELLCTICGLKACWMKPQDEPPEKMPSPQPA
jgi:hypothetical protein